MIEINLNFIQNKLFVVHLVLRKKIKDSQPKIKVVALEFLAFPL